MYFLSVSLFALFYIIIRLLMDKIFLLKGYNILCDIIYKTFMYACQLFCVAVVFRYLSLYRGILSITFIIIFSSYIKSLFRFVNKSILLLLIIFICFFDIFALLLRIMDSIFWYRHSFLLVFQQSIITIFNPPFFYF